MASLLTTLVLLGCVASALGAAQPASGGTTAVGGGSTAAEFLMKAILQNATATVNNAGQGPVRLIYNAVGSGGGATQLIQNALDYAVSDVPLSNANYMLATANGRQVDQIPFAVELLGIGYNLPGVSNLKLDGPTLAGIYQGTIKNWNDPAIAKQNPGVSLPNQPIVPLARIDASGSTQLLSDFLQSYAPNDWKLGVNETINFPNAVRLVQGSDGIVNNLKATPYSIGYNQLAQLTDAGIPVSSLANKQGNYVAPGSGDFEGILQELSGSNGFPSSTTGNFANVDPIASAQPQVYPISGLTYLIANNDLTSKGPTGALTKALIKYILSPNVQSSFDNYGYRGVPSGILNLSQNGANAINAPSTPSFSALSGGAKPAASSGRRMLA